MATLGAAKVSHDSRARTGLTHTVPCNEELPFPVLVVSICGNCLVKAAPVKSPDMTP
jgi:hypothetical protein